LSVDGDCFAVSPDGRRFAHVDRQAEKPVCRLKERGQADKILSLGSSADDLTFGHAVFSPDGEVVFVSILAQSADDGGPPGGLGFLEVPVDGSAVRRTLLVQSTRESDLDTPVYFELGLSGDGRTLAVASTYYAYDEGLLSADDCALFLVDLSDPNRKVTKVPVPVPPRPEATTE
jgi:hypothetical protein